MEPGQSTSVQPEVQGVQAFPVHPTSQIQALPQVQVAGAIPVPANAEPRLQTNKTEKTEQASPAASPHGAQAALQATQYEAQQAAAVQAQQAAAHAIQGTALVALPTDATTTMGHAAVPDNKLQTVGERMPPFLGKLFQIVSLPNTDNCIRWSDDGSSFVVSDQNTFAKTILPLYFKHNSMCSFIRQLNTYGFRKRTNMGSRSEYMEFGNENFKQNRMDLLYEIKRSAQPKSGKPIPCPEDATGQPVSVSVIGSTGTEQSATPRADDCPLKAETPSFASKAEFELQRKQVGNLHADVAGLRNEVKDMKSQMQDFMMQVDRQFKAIGEQLQTQPRTSAAPSPGASSGAVAGAATPKPAEQESVASNEPSPKRQRAE